MKAARRMDDAPPRVLRMSEWLAEQDGVDEGNPAIGEVDTDVVRDAAHLILDELGVNAYRRHQRREHRRFEERRERRDERHEDRERWQRERRQGREQNREGRREGRERDHMTREEDRERMRRERWRDEERRREARRRGRGAPPPRRGAPRGGPPRGGPPRGQSSSADDQYDDDQPYDDDPRGPMAPPPQDRATNSPPPMQQDDYRVTDDGLTDDDPVPEMEPDNEVEEAIDDTNAPNPYDRVEAAGYLGDLLRIGWGPMTKIGQQGNLRLQAKDGISAAVQEIAPGLFIVAEVPQGSKTELGGPVTLATKLVDKVKAALDNPAKAPAAQPSTQGRGGRRHHRRHPHRRRRLMRARWDTPEPGEQLSPEEMEEMGCGGPGGCR